MSNKRECYGVVLEGPREGPILMEAEGQTTSRDQAERRLRSVTGNGYWIRGCVVRLVYETGNRAVLDAMGGMHDEPEDGEDAKEAGLRGLFGGI